MKKILQFILCLFIVNTAYSQLSISDTNTDFTINFDSTVSGVNNSRIDGSGLQSTPSSGQLDSDGWKMLGFSNGNTTFGATNATNNTDFTRGISSGNVSGGGYYAFQVGGASDVALGFQPTGSDFSPGSYTLKITNNTGTTVTRFEIDYELWVHNNEDRSSSVNFSYSTDDSSYTSVGSLDFTSTATADGSPSWSSNAKTATIYGISISDGSSIFLRWSHSDVSGTGSKDEFAIDDIVIKLNGPISTTQNGDWDLDATWASGSVPASTDDIIIAHNNDVDDSRSCNSLTISAGGRLDVQADLTVASTSSMALGSILNVKSGGTYTQSAGGFTNTGGTITVFAGQDMIFSSGSTTLTNTGTIEINSSASAFGSLLLSGSYTESAPGVLNYRRYVASSTTWDLIGAPLSGYSIEDFVDDNTDLASNGSSPTTYAIGYYTNTSEAYGTNEGWTNYNSDTYDSAGDLEPGLGYQMATATGSVIKFTGNLETGNVTEVVTTNEEGTQNANDGTKFALVSNPYSAYISVADFINAHKTTQLHSGHAAVYGWDGNQYDTYNLASVGGNIAPGQGFMIGVKGADGTSQTITFTTAMQTATGTGDFSEQDIMNDRAELFINLNQNSSDYQTKLFFLNEGTDGLDIGYDAGALDFGNNLLYTRLVSDDEGINMVIQTLNFDEINNKVIPLGINAEAGAEATISISHNTTNPSTYVYLEDALEGTFTNLKETDFVITPDSNLEGVGRFFIHTTASTMSNEDATTNLLNVFKLDRNNFITVEGLSTESNQTNLKLYNILGKEILSTTLLNNTNTQTISTEGLSTGIYVIKLESGNNLLTKKLIIK